MGVHTRPLNQHVSLIPRAQRDGVLALFLGWPSWEGYIFFSLSCSKTSALSFLVWV